MTILTIVSLLVLSAIPSHAQFGNNDNFHHDTTTRIIAAVVVVVLFLLALALLGMSYRRRQQRRLGVQNIVLTRPPPPPGYWNSQGGPIQEPYAYNVPPQGYDPAAYSPPSGPPPKDGYYGNGGYAPVRSSLLSLECCASFPLTHVYLFPSCPNLSQTISISLPDHHLPIWAMELGMAKLCILIPLLLVLPLDCSHRLTTVTYPLLARHRRLMYKVKLKDKLDYASLSLFY
ncbi:hypothetical protein F5879DRAFT_948553 [Lentinula edodes]|nr:hypothetical protein F5879DRAFT_948553 [Lentinula edodes]